MSTLTETTRTIETESLTTVAGGDTKIEFDSEFYRILNDNNIEINIAGDAMLGDNDDSLNLPITGGEITDDSVSEWMGMAELQHRGSGLSFTHDGVTVELDDLTINTGTGDIYGRPKVMGSDMPIFDSKPVLFTLAETADLSAGLTTASTDENMLLDEAGIILSDDAAQLLNEAFGLHTTLDGDTYVGTATVTVSTG